MLTLEKFYIDQVASICDISKSKLRFYEKKEILKFIERDTNNKRLYSKDDIERYYETYKKIVYSNLITNSNGEVILEGIEPGTYYLQEVKATSGYQKMDGLVEFKMELNKLLTLTVNNNKVQKAK